MEEFRVFGGRRLTGQTKVSASKNAALPILAACLLTEEEVVLKDLPRIEDVRNMARILEALGCGVRWEENDLVLSPGNASGWELPDGLSKTLRSSIFLLGPLLGRFRKATATYPGGCEIGQRPVDLHLKGLQALGAEVLDERGMIYCTGENLRGGTVILDFPSVGATENAMMAAARIPGDTCIHNAAREPEIVDLQNFLIALGAKVYGAGTGCIRVTGVEKLHGCQYRPMPDRIVAGTLLMAAAVTGGRVELMEARAGDLTSPIHKLTRAGCLVEPIPGGLMLDAPERLAAQDVYTQPYPGFPTDLQAQWMALSCVSAGTALIVENLFESRFAHAAELRRMGADIRVEQRTAIVRGGTLTGARVRARDLRGGAALTLAALAARDYSEIENVALIDRGYQRLEEQLNSLGADIRRVRA